MHTSCPDINSKTSLLPLLIYQWVWKMLFPLLKFIHLLNLNPSWHLTDRLTLPSQSARPTIWFHCASIGEARGLCGLIERLKFPHHHLLLTATTDTGVKTLKNTLKTYKGTAHSLIRPFPPDASLFLNRYISRQNIRGLVLYEGELWPNLLRTMYIHHIPVFIVSARFAKGYRRWIRYFPNSFRHMMQQISFIQVQNEAEQKHLDDLLPESLPTALGADYKLLNTQQIPPDSPKRNRFSFVSLHKKELPILLPTIDTISKTHHVSILPRYLNEIPYFQKHLTPLGFKTYSNAGFTPLCITDRHGMVMSTLSHSNACFIGGSFIPTGGHNVFEPFLAGAYVTIGPYYNCQTYMVNLMRNHQCASVIESPEQLLDFISQTTDTENLHALKNYLSQSAIRATRELISVFDKFHLPILPND